MLAIRGSMYSRHEGEQIWPDTASPNTRSVPLRQLISSVQAHRRRGHMGTLESLSGWTERIRAGQLSCRRARRSLSSSEEISAGYTSIGLSLVRLRGVSLSFRRRQRHILENMYVIYVYTCSSYLSSMRHSRAEVNQNTCIDARYYDDHVAAVLSVPSSTVSILDSATAIMYCTLYATRPRVSQ